MHEVTEAAAKARLQQLSARTEAAAAAVQVRTGRDRGPKFWFRELHAYLFRASDAKLIKETHNQIRKLVLLSDPSGQRDCLDYQIDGGEINQKNHPDTPRITRDDGAWFDFGLTLRERKDSVELLSYRFALRIPSVNPPGLVRFDLNPPGHANDVLGLRAHTHLFNDDEGFSVPSPFMSPIEVLDVILFRLRAGTGRVRGAGGAGV